MAIQNCELLLSCADDQLCPIARHSPLPELQSLVKLFRPNAISPNTLVPDARGIDAFLLPAFFQDCISEVAFHGMERERDEWFRRTSGSEKLQQLKAMQSAGISLLPELEGEISPFGAVGAGRHANADAQLSRLAGITGMSMGQITHALVSRPRQEDEETDDESDQRRRRRRTTRQDPPSLASESKPLQTPQPKPEPPSNSCASVKTPKEDAAVNSRRISYFSNRISRVSVDKDHLRSLAQLGSQLDK